MSGLPDELAEPIDATDSVSDTIAVVGGGAIGVTAAYDLARRGASVTLYEAASIGSGATRHAAGICYDAFTDPTDARIAGESIDRLRRLSGDETFPFMECPYVWLADESDAAPTAEGIRTMQDNGVIALEVDGEGLGERFPSLETDVVAVAGIAGAAGYTDPVTYTACLAAAATGAGATIETETPVTVQVDEHTIVVDGTERSVDAVLVAAGAETASVFADRSLPLETYESTAVVAEGTSLKEPMVADAVDSFYLRPHEDGVLIGSDARAPISPEELCRRASDRLGTELESTRSHTGECTMTPDHRPMVGEIAPGIYIAAGFDGHGFMRAPALGEELASMILDSDEIAAYDPRRF